MTTERGRLVLLVLAVAAFTLIALELAFGGLGFGAAKLGDPCTTEATVQVGGIDGAVQRFALTALDGAACDLHTSREELVLSFASSHPRWDRATLKRALGNGVDRAVRARIGGAAAVLLAPLLRTIVADPLAWFLGRAGQ